MTPKRLGHAARRSPVASTPILVALRTQRRVHVSMQKPPNSRKGPGHRPGLFPLSEGGVRFTGRLQPCSCTSPAAGSQTSLMCRRRRFCMKSACISAAALG
jgi:hypothetical protein